MKVVDKSQEFQISDIEKIINKNLNQSQNIRKQAMIQQCNKLIVRWVPSLINKQTYKINSFNLTNEVPKSAFDQAESAKPQQNSQSYQGQSSAKYQKTYKNNSSYQNQTASTANSSKLPFTAWNDSIYVVGQTHTIYIIPIPAQLVQRKTSIGLAQRFHGLIMQFSKNVPKQEDQSQTKHINAKYFRIGLDQLDKIIYHDLDSQNQKDLFLMESNSAMNKYLRVQKDAENNQVKLSIRFKGLDGSEQDEGIDVDFPITKFKFIQDNIKLSLPYLTGWAFMTQQYQQKNMIVSNYTDDFRDQ